MAQSYVTDSGTLIIPGAYSAYKVQTANSGLATTGVLMLVGEADAGPDFTEEEDLQENAFGPDQLAEVVAKYKSGALVDAFRLASAPANDPNIVGAPSRIILVKTNAGTQATATLDNHAAADYAVIRDRSFGRSGNLIYTSVEADATEVVPTTSAFTFLPPTGGFTATIRANGSDAADGALTVTSGMTPAAFVSAVNALTVAVTASGGVAKTLLSGTGDDIVLTHAGSNVVTLAHEVAWDVTLVAGDTLVIPTGSPFAANNEGSYQVTAATSTTITAKKYADAPGGVPGTITAPTTETVAVAATTNVQAWSAVTIALTAADPQPGLGKSLELAQTGGADSLVNAARTTAGAAVSWVSASGAPVLVTSATEYRALVNVNRQTDGIQEEFTMGGEVVLRIGYDGDSAEMVIDDDTLTVTTSVGAEDLSLDLEDYDTLSDLASYINAQTNYTCAVQNAQVGQLSPTVLDDGTYGIATTHGGTAGRVKADAYKFTKAINENSVLVEVSTEPDAGLPAPASTAYLAGGTKGATLQADVIAAIDALERVRGNFLIPLFSRDASEDIADGLTDAASTYEVDAINAAAKTHCLKVSTIKRRRNRQAIVSKAGAFDDQKEAAANLATFRCGMTFQDVKAIGTTGTIVQYQPWMAAVLAGAMQAAGFYRAIVNKGANISGIVHAEGDFTDRDDTQMEEALLAGLMPLKRPESGGFVWVSDQTTYGKDSNFVFNSLQAVYVADIIALTTAERMETAFVGQSVADVSAPVALSFLEGIMADFLRLKLIAPSDDAPRGYKNVVIRISGPTMIVSLEVKLAGALYFIPINFLVSQVTQTASS